MTYGEFLQEREQELKSKPNQKIYLIWYGYTGKEKKFVQASSKADARKLARVGRISKIEQVKVS